MAAVGGVLLLLLLAVQLPKLLSRGGRSSGSATPAAVVPAVPAAPDTTATTTVKAYRAALKQAPHDVFTVRQLSSDNTLGAVATPAGLHDPFAKPHSSQAAIAPPTQKPVMPCMSSSPAKKFARNTPPRLLTSHSTQPQAPRLFALLSWKPWCG